MESNLAKELNGKFNPIVLIKTDEEPKNAIGPKSREGNCIMPFIAQVIVNGKTAVFSRNKCTCAGAFTGFGFGSGYTLQEYGLDIYNPFLSLGLKVAKDKEAYKKFVKSTPERIRPMFEGGERIYDSYERCNNFLTNENYIYDNDEEFVVFKPLSEVIEGESPSNVIFTVNRLEFSALNHLFGAISNELNYCMTPQASACQAIGNQVFYQAEQDKPKAVLGLLDIASIQHIKRWIPDDYITYSIPWDLYLKLEEASKDDSVFQGYVWNSIKKDKK